MRSPHTRFSFIVSLFAALMLVAGGDVNAQDTIAGIEHWVPSVSAADGKPLNLFVWEKRQKDIDVKEYAKGGRVVLLAHGATTPGSLAFDFQLSSKTELTYSLMNYLAERGFDVFALEYQNYGRSDKHECGICVSTQVAANDINAVVDYVRSQRDVEKVYLLGWSWGTLTAGLFTMQRPDKVRRLVLYAPPVWRGPREKAPTAQFRPVTVEVSKNLFEPQATDPEVIETFVREAVKYEKAPNGCYIDLFTKMPVTDPKQIPVPTMIILGELDRLTPINQPELPGFFADLPNPDKQFIIVPGAGHALMLQKPRLRFFVEVVKWLSLDQPGWRMEAPGIGLR